MLRPKSFSLSALSFSTLCPLLLAAASCYSFIGRYDATDDGRKQPGTTATTPIVDTFGRRYWYVPIAKEEIVRRETYADELFDCTPVGASMVDKHALGTFQRAGQPRAVLQEDAAGGSLIFRVGLISDVHIRQSAVKLFNDKLSRSLRYVINSFERNGYQEAFQPAVFAATVSAFNSLDKVDDKPRLIIDTGDATDAGTVEEAYDFSAVANHLHYPMLYAIGNHDDAIFGNYKPRLGYTKNAGPVFYPIGERERFMRTFNSVPDIGGFSDGLVPLPANYNKAAADVRWKWLDVPRESEAGAEGDQPYSPANAQNSCGLDRDSSLPPVAASACKISTYCRGFDLNGKMPSDRQNCHLYDGYYAVVVPGDSGARVQLIALNTTRGSDEWGEDATFDEPQRAWLKKQLAIQPTPDVTIVFAHHRPADVPGLMANLGPIARSRPFVFLSGHTHSHATEWHDDGHFWEINTGSLEEFPQWARLVEIRRAADNARYYLSARVLKPASSVLDLREAASTLPPIDPEAWDTLSPTDKRRLLGWFETRFAECDALAAASGKQCRRFGVPPVQSGSLLRDSARCGYIGALYDHVMVLDQYTNAPPSPKGYPARDGPNVQTGADASVEANVVFDISP